MPVVELRRVAEEEFRVIQAGELIPLGPAEKIPPLKELDRAQDARQHHLRLGVGLRNKVGGAEIQALHLRFLIRRHDDEGQHGGDGVRLDLAQDIHPVHIGKVQIQQHKAERPELLIQDLQPLGARLRENDVIGFPEYIVKDHPVDDFVLDHEDLPFFAV